MSFKSTTVILFNANTVFEHENFSQLNNVKYFVKISFIT